MPFRWPFVRRRDHDAAIDRINILSREGARTSIALADARIDVAEKDLAIRTLARECGDWRRNARDLKDEADRLSAEVRSLGGAPDRPRFPADVGAEVAVSVLVTPTGLSTAVR